MRRTITLHFQERPVDLYIVLSYTIVASGTILILGVGNPLASLLVFLTPGYSLVSVIFPEHRRIDWLERIVLGVGLSLAIVPLLGFVLNYTPFGVSFTSVVVALA